MEIRLKTVTMHSFPSSHVNGDLQCDDRQNMQPCSRQLSGSLNVVEQSRGGQRLLIGLPGTRPQGL